MRIVGSCALVLIVAGCRVGYDAVPCGPGAPDCPLGTRCDDGRCVPRDACVGDSDCAANERCAAGSKRCLRLGSCLADSDCPDGIECTPDGICGECGGTSIGLLPGNLMIVLDRTASMGMPLGGSTRWEVAKTAIERITTAFEGRIRFGLTTYSACLPGGCSPGAVVVPITDDPAAVNDYLRPLQGTGSATGAAPDYLCETMLSETSTGATLRSLVGSPALSEANRNPAVLLLTDGANSAECAPPGPDGAAALLGQRVAVRTFAIGVGDDALMSELDAIAAAGGTTTAFRASAVDELDSALDVIAGDVAACTYGLPALPPDPALAYVFADGTRVPESAEDGYVIDAASRQLRLHGGICRRLQSGAVERIEVVFACAE
ncbi:MAG: VWA domain-containing protein [Deltaproteobacteria bacterium]|nr:VWA domain-containing protein [Deltaproteobacteria bacterium]